MSPALFSGLVWRLALLGPAAHAAAEGGDPFQVTPEDCDELDGAEVARLLALELAGELESAEIASAEGAPALQIRLRCGEDEVAIDATDPLSGVRLSRRFPAPDASIGRERTMALVVAQLLLSSFVEAVSSARAELPDGAPPEPPHEADPRPAAQPPEASTPVQVAPVDPPSPAPAPAPAPPTPWTIELGAGAVGLELDRRSGPIPGPRVELGATGWLGAHLGLGLVTGLEVGVLPTPTGRVRTASTELGAVVAGRWSPPRARWALRGAVEGSLALARVRGLPEEGAEIEGRALTGLGAAFRARAGLRVRLGRGGIGLDLTGGARYRNPLGAVEGGSAASPGGPFVGALLVGSLGPPRP